MQHDAYHDPKLASNGNFDLPEWPGWDTDDPTSHNDPQDSNDSQHSNDPQDTQDPQGSTRLTRKSKELICDEPVSKYSGSSEKKELTEDTSGLYKLSFPRFIEAAAEHSEQQAIDKSQVGEYQSPTWTFVRLCKAHPKLTTLTADQALERIPWERTEFGEDAQLSFLCEWDRVNFLPGMSPLDWALKMAREKTLIPPAPRQNFKTYGLFLSIAGWLQILLGEKAIFLPCRKIADTMGVSFKTVSDLRRLAVKDRLLEVVEPHTRKLATAFRFAVERYPILRERQ